MGSDAVRQQTAETLQKLYDGKLRLERRNGGSNTVTSPGDVRCTVLSIALGANLWSTSVAPYARANASGFSALQIAGDVRDCRSEVDRLNRHGDVRLEPCRQDANSIFGAREASQRKRGKEPAAFSLGLANMSNQGEPVLIRQADIGHQCIGPLHLQ